MGTALRIELLHVPNCPHVADARLLLTSVMEELNIDASIEELEGAYPSPTIRVDGVDVMGEPASKEASCRLDVPTRDRLIAALARSEG